MDSQFYRFAQSAKSASRCPISRGDQRTSVAGLTLIECLVAIVVIGISVAAVTPALVLTVATRVQSQQAEQALNLAQTEIDQVRLVVERGNDGYAASTPLTTPIADIRTVPSPVNFVASTTSVDQAQLVDVDGDGSDDFAIQTFRNAGYTPSGTTDPIAFDMGVRVYSIQSQDNLGSLESTQADIGLTSGTGQRRNKPLAVLYTTIVRGEADSSLCGYVEFIDSTASTSLSCS
ncbi:MAG: prepilin-type N-terminal cleavage/methylation domain-containing protein [Leptolyngbyaceae cyanobacterium]